MSWSLQTGYTLRPACPAPSQPVGAERGDGV